MERNDGSDPCLFRRRPRACIIPHARNDWNDWHKWWIFRQTPAIHAREPAFSLLPRSLLQVDFSRRPRIAKADRWDEHCPALVPALALPAGSARPAHLPNPTCWDAGELIP